MVGRRLLRRVRQKGVHRDNQRRIAQAAHSLQVWDTENTSVCDLWEFVHIQLLITGTCDVVC